MSPINNSYNSNLPGTGLVDAQLAATKVGAGNGNALATDAIKKGQQFDAISQAYGDAAWNRALQQASIKELKDAAKGAKEMAGS